MRECDDEVPSRVPLCARKHDEVPSRVRLHVYMKMPGLKGFSVSAVHRGPDHCGLCSGLCVVLPALSLSSRRPRRTRCLQYCLFVRAIHSTVMIGQVDTSDPLTP